MKPLISLLIAVLMSVLIVSYVDAQSPEIHMEPIGDGFEITTNRYVAGIEETRRVSGTCEIYKSDDGMLHFELLKMKGDVEEWYQNRDVFGIVENSITVICCP